MEWKYIIDLGTQELGRKNDKDYNFFAILYFFSLKSVALFAYEN